MSNAHDNPPVQPAQSQEDLKKLLCGCCGKNLLTKGSLPCPCALYEPCKKYGCGKCTLHCVCDKKKAKAA